MNVLVRARLIGTLFLLSLSTSGCAWMQAARFSAGYTGSSASYDSEGSGTEVKTKPGFNMGVGAELPLGEAPVTFLPELQFSQEGAKFVSDLGGGMTDEGTTSTSYLRVPALFGLRLGSGTGVRPTVFAGPNFGYLLSCNDEYGSESYDCADEKKKFDVAGTFGAGVDFPVGERVRAGIDARYNLGLTNILDVEYDGISEKNRNWQLRGSIAIPVGGR